MDLTQAEMERYARHLILDNIGLQGQRKLKDAKVLIVGAGGLGSSSSIFLASAGIGTLGLVDFDKVEANNLQRQIIYKQSDIGEKKVSSAQAHLQEVNPFVNIMSFDEKLTAENAKKIIEQFDIVIDGTDNIDTKLIVNKTAVALGKPLVYGAIVGFQGQVTLLRGKPCLQCFYKKPENPPTCAAEGVATVLPGIIGNIQATEVMKLILGKGKTLENRLLVYDGLQMKFEEFALPAREDCEVCGSQEKPKEPTTEEKPQQEHIDLPDHITVEELKELIDKKEEIELIDVRQKREYDICNLPGAKLIPLSELGSRLSEIDKTKRVIVYCHTGGRSHVATELLRDSGYKAQNLAGGIAAWASRIDNSMATY